MSASKLLGQFLGANTGQAGTAKGGEPDLMQMLQTQLGQGGLQGLLGGGTKAAPGTDQGPGNALSGLLSGGVGKAALAGGALGVLLKGGKKPKKIAASAAKLGGLGLVAGLAWRAYQQHQQGQNAPAETAAQSSAPAQLAAPEGSAFLPSEDDARQRQSRKVLKAMIAAAKADGHVDDAERERLYQAVDMLALEAEDKAFIFDELRHPLDVAALAREADTPELASELYVASLLMVDETNAAERAYLDSLADALRLEPALQRHLESEVAQATG